MKRIYKFFTGTIITLLLAGVVFGANSTYVYADDPIVIVLDPGHGGENLGAEYEQYTEKNMTMALAQAMKEELEKYDNVEVYLTHDTDVDMSLKDRAAFAAEKNADFLFCLHFNMSVKHDLFGAEVWVPSTGQFYAKGYSFAEIEMADLTALGLYSRGIKTKINDENKNYYGILRFCTENEVPSVLIEHCHLDQANDKVFYQKGEEQLKAFGVLDATAVAKYFRLTSTELGISYSDYDVPECEEPEGIVRPDQTEPEICQIKVESIDEETGEVTVHMEAQDSDSYILYCNYSLDGGNTYSDLMEWPRPEKWNQSLGESTFTITVPFDKKIELRTTAYNSFDVWTESNIITIEPIEDPIAKAQREKEELRQQYEEITYDEETLPEVKKPAVWPMIILIIILLILIVIVSFFLAKTIRLIIRNKRKR